MGPFAKMMQPIGSDRALSEFRCQVPRPRLSPNTGGSTKSVRKCKLEFVRVQVSIPFVFVPHGLGAGRGRCVSFIPDTFLPIALMPRISLHQYNTHKAGFLRVEYVGVALYFGESSWMLFRTQHCCIMTGSSRSGARSRTYGASQSRYPPCYSC